MNIGPGLLRFILAFMVVIYHSTRYFPLGRFAVYVFFILSGYWIFRMYDEKYQRYERPYKTFMISRILRLFPVYYLCLALIIIIKYTLDKSNIAPFFEPDISNFAYWSQNLVLLTYNLLKNQILRPAWSLDIELQFYLMAPFLLGLFTSFKPKTWLVVLLSASLLVYLISALFQVTYFDCTLLAYLPFFVIGGFIYKQGLAPSRNIARYSFLAVIIVFMVHYAFPSFRDALVSQTGIMFLGYDYFFLLNIYLALITIPFVAYNVRQKSSKLDQRLGGMSYVLYLFHWVMNVPFRSLVQGVSLWEKIPYLIGYLLVTLIGTIVISVYFDSFFEKLRKRWLKSQVVKDNPMRVLIK